MPKRSEFLRPCGLLPLAAAFLIAATASAAAQQYEPTPLQRLLGAVGLIELPGGDPIEYRERAPLVVPPSPALVPPRAPDDMSQLNPDWPVDHGGRRRPPTKEEIDAQNREEELFYSGVPMQPHELQRGRISRQEAARRAATVRPAEGEMVGGDVRSTMLTPSQLGFRSWGAKKEERVVFSGEPERRSLTDPPVGLRTPSPAAPYGIVSTKSPSAKRDPLNIVLNPDDPSTHR